MYIKQHNRRNIRGFVIRRVAANKPTVLPQRQTKHLLYFYTAYSSQLTKNSLLSQKQLHHNVRAFISADPHIMQLLEQSFSTTSSSLLQENSTMWTPGCYTGHSSSDDKEDRSTDVITQYNKALEILSEAACEHRPSLLTYLLKNWDSASIKEKTECREKASEACSLICKIIAPNDVGTLFQS